MGDLAGAVDGEPALGEADVVVAGGGGAGLAAAVTAAECGSRVVLLEKNP